MKKFLTLALLAIISLGASANKTFPQKGTFVSPANPQIIYNYKQ